MPFNLLGAGAGAGVGLEALLARLREDEDSRVKNKVAQQEVNQRLQIAQMTDARQREINQTNAQIRKDQADAQAENLRSLAADRTAKTSQSALSLYGTPSDDFDPKVRDLILKGMPEAGGLFRDTPGAKVQQTQGIAALPQSAPSGLSTLPMKAPVMPAEPSTTTTDMTSTLNAPSKIRFSGTNQANLAAEKQSETAKKDQAAIDARITALNQAADRAEMAGRLQEAQAFRARAEGELAQFKASGGAGQETPQMNFRSYSYNADKLAKERAPLSTLASRVATANDDLAKGNASTDAVTAPAILTIIAGGQGSGLRMTEAEIRRIVGGRSAWEDLQAMAQHYKTDGDKAGTLTPDQRERFKDILRTVQARIGSKLTIIEDADQALIKAKTIEEHRQIVADTKKKLDQIDTGLDSGTGGEQLGGGDTRNPLDILNSRRPKPKTAP